MQQRRSGGGESLIPKEHEAFPGTFSVGNDGIPHDFEALRDFNG